MLPVDPGESADYAITGTFVGTVDIEQSGSPTTHFETLASAADAGYSGTLDNTTGDRRWFRFRSTPYPAWTPRATALEFRRTSNTSKSPASIILRKSTGAIRSD